MVRCPKKIRRMKKVVLTKEKFPDGRTVVRVSVSPDTKYWITEMAFRDRTSISGWIKKIIEAEIVRRREEEDKEE